MQIADTKDSHPRLTQALKRTTFAERHEAIQKVRKEEAPWTKESDCTRLLFPGSCPLIFTDPRCSYFAMPCRFTKTRMLAWRGWLQRRWPASHL